MYIPKAFGRISENTVSCTFNKGEHMEFIPKWIAWEITRRCNLRCVHCRSSSELEAKAHPDFPTEEAFRIIDDIAGYAKPVIVLSGGEPLLKKRCI